MKKLLLLPLLFLSVTVFGQFTKPQLYNGINTNIRLKTSSQKRLADMLDSIVVTMSTGGSGTVNSGTQYRLAYYAATGNAVSEASAITAARALKSDANGVPTHFDTTTEPSMAELAHVKGLTSAAQTQINTKAPTTSPTFATSITGSYLTASEILITDGSKNIVSAAVATYPSLTELSYVKGLTSSGQTQLDAKVLKVNAAGALTDAASMDLTAIKHTLATSSATRTFTISYTGDDITIEVTLSNTAATYTFPAGSLCISEGVASGDNTVGLSGVSGDKYIIGIKKIGSIYYVAVKNFGQ